MINARSMILKSGIALSVLILTLSGATSAQAAPAEDNNVHAGDGYCISQGQSLLTEYQAENDLGPGDSTYLACTNGVPTVWAIGDDGQELAPKSDLSSVESDDGATQTDMQARSVDGFSCGITDVWEVECTWGTTYQKYNGSTLVWSRTISAYSLTNLQQISQQVYQRYTNDQNIPMSTSGNVILQRQQGVTPPTFESQTGFSFGLGTQTSGTTYVNRVTNDEGKYSIIFNLEYVFDSSEGVNIPIVGDPTSPRFQCFASSVTANCEFPNGQEAGVF